MTATRNTTRHPVVLLGGGIGAGKSRIASIFADRGFTVIEADKVGHGILEHDAGAIAAVAARWPEAVTDGVVERSALARIVFVNTDELEHLESITHPAIGKELSRRIDEATRPVVVEVPVMKVLTDEPYLRVAVVADATIRENRAVARGGDRDDVRSRMEKQPADAQWLDWADKVIENTGSWEATVVDVNALIDEVLGDG